MNGDIDASGMRDEDVIGTGGAIDLGAGGDAILGGAIKSNGSNGDGGDIDVVALGNVAVGGTLITNGGQGDGGSGGAVAITAEHGNFSLSGGISALGSEGTGGSVTITTGGHATLTGNVMTNGSNGDAGDVDVVAEGEIDVSGNVHADGQFADSAAGRVTLEAKRDHRITIASTARVQAIGSEGDGRISLDACDVAVDGYLNTRGPTLDGNTIVVYRAGFSGTGIMRAGDEDETGGNEINCRSNGAGSCVALPSDVDCNVPARVCASDGLTLLPEATLKLKTLGPCVGCGNLVVDAGEECDDGNSTPCDGCAPDCKRQLEGDSCGAAACMNNGVCLVGDCQSSSPKDCDDANLCTEDGMCDPITGCSYTPVGCDDLDPTTTDTCNVVTGCVHIHALTPAESAGLTGALTVLLDPCATSDPIACAATAYSCTALSAVDRPKATISKLQAPAGDERLKLAGQATFTPLQPPLDPTGKGLRLIISDTQRPIVDVTVPSGALSTSRGWVSTPSSNPVKWKYADRTAAPVGGITKIAIKVGASGVVTFSVQGTGNYGVSAANLPLTAVVILDPKADTTTQCGYLSFPAPTRSCRLNGSGTTLKCR